MSLKHFFVFAHRLWLTGSHDQFTACENGAFGLARTGKKNVGSHWRDFTHHSIETSAKHNCLNFENIPFNTVCIEKACKSENHTAHLDMEISLSALVLKLHSESKFLSTKAGVNVNKNNSKLSFNQLSQSCDSWQTQESLTWLKQYLF